MEARPAGGGGGMATLAGAEAARAEHAVPEAS